MGVVVGSWLVRVGAGFWVMVVGSRLMKVASTSLVMGSTALVVGEGSVSNRECREEYVECVDVWESERKYKCK